MAYDHNVGSAMTEAEAVRARYARRSTASDPALPCFLAERERTMGRWMVETGIDPSTARVLEIGCGTGGNLLDLMRLGFAPANLTGIELQHGRAEEARRRLPSSVKLIDGDALNIAFDPGTFDIVMLFTVFTSLLDEEYRERLAKHIWHAVKPGGGVLWYDFCFDNPRNPDVSGVPVKAIRRLFPEGALQCRRITLAPPLARAAVRLHPSLYSLLNTIPFLRTHVLCWIGKSGPVEQRPD